MMENEGIGLEEVSEHEESTSGNLVLLLLLVWATIALGGYYIAVRMIA